jgi:hypothetical protein
MEYKIVMIGNVFMNLNGKILEHEELFEYLVNKSIGDGWRPIGGVSYDGEVYCQAMI